MNKELDLIVFGATSLSARLFAVTLRMSALSRIFPGPWRPDLKNSKAFAQPGNGAEHIPIIVAESFDKAALAALCDRTAVVLSTVGPYALYWEALVEDCVTSGTDYCDLTGESQWMKRMISRYSEQAKLSGARIVHACGFDSLPSDLGVKFLQQHSQTRFGEPCSTVKMRVKAMKGGASGGTVASG